MVLIQFQLDIYLFSTKLTAALPLLKQLFDYAAAATKRDEKKWARKLIRNW